MTEQIQKLAAEALAFFTTDNPRKVWSYKEDETPQWVQDMVFAAHGNGAILPDDFIYTTIVDVLERLAEGDSPDDLHIEADITHADLLAWVGSHGERWGRVDEAMQEFKPENLAQAITYAQEQEKREIAAAVVHALEERADEAWMRLPLCSMDDEDDSDD